MDKQAAGCAGFTGSNSREDSPPAQAPCPPPQVPSSAAPADEEPRSPLSPCVRVLTRDTLLGSRAGKEGAGEQAARPGCPAAHSHLETPPLFMLGSVTHGRSLLPPGTIFGRWLPFSRSETGHARGTQWQGQASPWCLASVLALSLLSVVRVAQKREHCPLGGPLGGPYPRPSSEPRGQTLPGSPSRKGL